MWKGLVYRVPISHEEVNVYPHLHGIRNMPGGKIEAPKGATAAQGKDSFKKLCDCYSSSPASTASPATGAATSTRPETANKKGRPASSTAPQRSSASSEAADLKDLSHEERERIKTEAERRLEAKRRQKAKEAREAAQVFENEEQLERAEEEKYTSGRGVVHHRIDLPEDTDESVVMVSSAEDENL